MDRVTAIRKSLTAYGCGIAACVPFIGVVFALCAIVISEQVIRRYHDWNPAAHYVKRSQWLALLGVAITFVLTFVILFANVNCEGADGGQSYFLD